MAHPHNYWMKKAIAQAKLGQTPYAAVLVDTSENYVVVHNTTKIDGPQAHAEMNAIKQIKQLKPYNPKDLKLYSTVEPCPMCMSALVWTGIGQLIYGASIDDAAKYGHQIHISSKEIADKAWYKIDIIPKIERKNCMNLFVEFK
jgi:tRNA(Arg) A34 adenosine deaminase TadA